MRAASAPLPSSRSALSLSASDWHHTTFMLLPVPFETLNSGGWAMYR